MMIHFDHTEPPAAPDHPDRFPPMPPAPDVVPVHDPLRPEHPDPVKEPPTHEPPISAWARRESRERVRVAAALVLQRAGQHAAQRSQNASGR